MNKFGKFAKTIPMKLYILLALVIVFAFFSNDFGLVDIQKTAIILAAGIDRTENGFAVTAQISIPKGTDRSSCGTSSVEILGEGDTVSACIAQIYSKTGWVPKLVFCDLIVIGEETAKQDVFGCLDFFLRNEYMPDSCLLAVCEGKASDTLTMSSAIDDTSSLAIEKLFSDAAGKSGKVVKSTLKEFSIGYFGKAKSGHIPFVRSTNQTGGCTSNSSGPEGGPSSGAGENEKKIFSAEETAVFSEGKMVALLSRAETFAYNLLKGNVFSGVFSAEDDGDPVSLTVLKDEGGVSLDMKGAPKAVLSVNLRVRLYNSGVPAPVENMAESSPSPETVESAKRIIDGYIDARWKKCAESGCDLFQLSKSLYRSSPQKYEEWKDTLLSVIQPEIKTEIRIIK